MPHPPHPTAVTAPPGRVSAATPPPAVRVAACVALVAAVALTAWVLVHGRPTYEVTARFVSAGSLVKGDIVRQGASAIGEVGAIGLADDGVAEVKLRIDPGAAPLPEGSTATIRLDGLAGVANRYVTIDRPLRARGDIRDGGVIPTKDTQAPVDFDALFDALDAPTRRGLQALVRGQAQLYAGKVPEARANVDALAPALSGVAGLSQALTRNQPAFRRLLLRGAAAMSALGADRSQLTALVSNTGRATAAIGAQQQALRAGLHRLPVVLRRATTTFGTLRTTLDALDPLVRASSQAVPTLPGLLGQARTTVRAGGPPLTDLAAVVARPGADNDLVDALSGAPALARLSRTALPRAARVLVENLPELRQLRAYAPDVVAALSRVGQVTANYDANGHYARTQADLLAFALDPSTNQLRPRTSGNAFDQLQTKQSQRCPGGALQALLDGSAPVQVPGCELTATPGGAP